MRASIAHDRCRQGKTVLALQSMLRPGTTSALLVLALLGVGLAGCGHDAPPRRSGYPFLSPNGEPLSGGPLGQPSCREAMGRWFDRLDADHGGTITRDIFLADARRQFAVMDLDKDGLVTPAELGVYRAPYITAVPAEPERRVAEAPRMADIGQPGGGRPSGRAGDARRSSESNPAADRPDPVMAADVNLRNQVSLSDFLAHAGRSFVVLNARHDGHLSRDEILRSCGPDK
jgi:hypothetical protein